MLGEIVQQFIQDSLNSSSSSTDRNSSTGDWKPSLDLLDNDNEISIYLMIPGVKNSSIDIDILNNRMMISGERETPYSESDYQIKRTEINYGRFQRVITLPVSVTNQGSVSTQFRDGLLMVRVDKRIEQQNRFTVRVNSGSIENTTEENNN